MKEPRDKGVVLRLAGREFPVPATKGGRLLLGWTLTAAGVLPVVGWGFLPLGLMVLSIDSHAVRRVRRLLEVRWGRRGRTTKPSKDGKRRNEGSGQKERAGSEPGPKALGNGGVSSREDKSNMPP